MKGLYIHIPFCLSKCSYCSFYSFAASEAMKDEYLSSLLLHIDDWGKKEKFFFDSVYFGGGTPSVFGGERLFKVLSKLKESFFLSPDCEITVEVNPSSASEELFSFFKKGGVNRISMGVQSAVTKERKTIGRNSDCEQVKAALSLCKKFGIENTSLDLMLGLPFQTKESLEKSLDFIIASKTKHVSAYMLKLEEGTPLFEKQNLLPLPDEDEVCDMYLRVCEKLKENGFEHYEISNFALPGFQSRHNNKYWLCEEYLGLGPSAHSFLGGKRFFYKNDIGSFIKNEPPISDGSGGDEEEFSMLALRLSKGLVFDEFENRFKKKYPEEKRKKAEELQKYGLLKIDEKKITLTEKGFLLSNSVIAELC
ncbi:MAG: radical SAM family heme chaperone HemW [Clostridia bacterium]|nr:radical SAM family heme chaperone HemW [Clostridia bacterium]